MSISKQRAIILRKAGRGYFNGKVIENIRIRKQQKQASCLCLPTHTEFCVTTSSSWKKPAGSLQSYLHIQPHELNWFFCSVSSKLICACLSVVTLSYTNTHHLYHSLNKNFILQNYVIGAISTSYFLTLKKLIQHMRSPAA